MLTNYRSVLLNIDQSESSIANIDHSQVSRAEYTRVAQSDSWEEQSDSDSEGDGDQQGEHNGRE